MYNFQRSSGGEKGKKEHSNEICTDKQMQKEWAISSSSQRKYIEKRSLSKRKLITDVRHIRGDKRRNVKAIGKHEILKYKKELRGHKVVNI